MKSTQNLVKLILKMIRIYQFLLAFYLVNVAFSSVCHGGGVVDPSGKM